MGKPLVAEYLQNVGYDLAKPDRHICRILVKDYPGCSEQEEVLVYEAFDLIKELSESMGRKIFDFVQQINFTNVKEKKNGQKTRTRDSNNILLS